MNRLSAITRPVFFFGLFLLATLGGSCKKDTKFNLFTKQQDIEIGLQMDSIILSDPAKFPILDRAKHPEAYAYLEDMMNRIQQSDVFVNKNIFTFRLMIIDQEVMNAFAVPGGSMYYYTGLMKYLDNSAQLAGVMAHEMAHIDRRHSSAQLSKAYGVSSILSLLVGKEKSQLEEFAINLATGLASLSFSRQDEYEADEYAVRYITDTEYYHPRGIAGFFEKLEAEGKTAANFEFLSTHPTDENRVANINKIWESLGSPSGNNFVEEFKNFKEKMLP